MCWRTDLAAMPRYGRRNLTRAAGPEMPTHPEKPPDQSRIVAFLAKESQVPLADVARIYEAERAELALGARVTKYLHIFAIRNAQEILRKQSADPQGT
ncbi:DUF3562 domain-containing protein [Niveibacterium sp. SC-1]|uniref:DUF3562 domain-containing protein n=1 Tax=Niveibacterium sp. SC-1 TaxID=3135646 RepID=UPI00311ECA44